MKVSLVSVTPEAERHLVECARVSSPRKDKTEKQSQLIGYLIRNKHWSPFELSNMVIEIETSRAIAQQILRHRSFSFQEFSQRYAEVEGCEPIELRRQAQKNRQSSWSTINGWLPRLIVWATTKFSFWSYRTLLRLGVAKECARFVLPLATTTRIYMQGTTRSWIHYLQIRGDGHTQKEHRDIAAHVSYIFGREFPLTAKALGWR
jgi:thymidylate synthase (FAD)